MSRIEWNDELRSRLLACDTDRKLASLAKKLGANASWLKGHRTRLLNQHLSIGTTDLGVTKAEIQAAAGNRTEDESKNSEADAHEETAKDRRISRLTADLAHLRKLYKTATSESAGMDAMIDAIRELVPVMQPVLVPALPLPNSDIDEESLVLLLSDLHIGEIVSAEQTGGISVFNADIARRRILQTVETAISISRDKMANFNFRKLKVFLLGDLVSGIIHDELRVNDELGIVGQCILAHDILAEAILLLCQAFEEVHIASVVGNHGRVTTEYYFKGKAVNNYDYLVSQMLARSLESQANLTWNIPKSFFAVEQVENERFLLLHGDIVKSWMGIPFYGLQRSYFKWHALHSDYGMPFDHMIVGHFHNPNRMTMLRNELIINGCIKGGDEYSIGAIAAACDPSQTMFGVHPRKGITHYWVIKTADVV